MNRLIFLIIPAIFFFSHLSAQINHQLEILNSGTINLSPGISIPKINSGYSLWLPKEKALGMVVFFHPNRDSINRPEVAILANDRQLAILYVNTDNRLEFLFETAKKQELENYIHQVLNKHQIGKKLFYAGMSLAGTRALKMAIHGQTKESKHKLKPLAVAVCDSPLDMVRFWKECVNAWKLNFSPVAANEGEWVSQYLETNLGGTPEQNLKGFTGYSPYCHIAENGGNAGYFENIAVCTYTEPDINWWMEFRHKDYYGMNALDMAALVNQLNILGNENAELIITHDKGKRPDGTKHPHSWSIVDEDELMDWFITFLKD